MRDDLLVGIQADEGSFGRDLDLIGMTLLEALQAVLELTIEDIAHGGQHDILVRVHRLAGRSGSASPATDQANAKGVVVTLGKEVSLEDGRRGENTAHQR